MALTAADWNQELLWFGHMFRTTNTSINFSLLIQLAAFLVVAFQEVSEMTMNIRIPRNTMH